MTKIKSMPDVTEIAIFEDAECLKHDHTTFTYTCMLTDNRIVHLEQILVVVTLNVRN